MMRIEENEGKGIAGKCGRRVPEWELITEGQPPSAVRLSGAQLDRSVAGILAAAFVICEAL